MAVISIRKYLNDNGTDSTNPLLRVCAVLLEGMIRAALAYDRDEYSEFSANLRTLAIKLETSKDARELLGVAESATEALEKYNRGAQSAHAAQTVELRMMIEMLSEALVMLSQAGGQSVENLQNIREQLEQAHQLDDIRLVRARLGDALKSISEEAQQQRERNSEILRKAEEAARLASLHRDEPPKDRVSGLPSCEQAESEIAARVGPNSRYCAAVFVVERVESVNLRYGYAAGDQLLQAFARYLEEKLTLGDQLFRWRGPTFLLVLERSGPAESVRAEVARYASNLQEYATEVDGRPVKLPLSSAWTLLPLGGCQVAGQANQQIDRFVAEHCEKRG